jgi:Septum formation
MSSPTAEDEPPADPALPGPASAAAITPGPLASEPVTTDLVTVPGASPVPGGLPGPGASPGPGAGDTPPAQSAPPAAAEPGAGAAQSAPPAAAEPGAGAAAKPPFSKVAIAALPTGVLPLIPVGLGLGIAGLVTTRRGRRRGRGMAVAGLLTATTWLAVAITLVTVAALTHGFRKPTKIEYDNQLGTVFSLREGDCIDTGGSGTSVTITSCSSPHDAEVFATFALTGPAWPGTAAVQQEADTGCSARLSGYLNPQLAISLSQDYVYPGQVAWQTGTRTVVCEVRATSGLLSQSVRAGSAS